MNSVLVVLAMIVCAGIIWIVPAEGSMAIIVCGLLAIAVLLIISRAETDKQFMMRLFVGGLLIRMVIGSVIYVFRLQEFFGGDAATYDFFGFALLRGWQGVTYYQGYLNTFIGISGSSGWGMVYMVAVVYGLIGRNMLAIQFINSVLGAATAPIIALCAWHVFQNRKVGRLAAFMTAFFPSLVLWSSQGLKDGPIVFLLALSILAILKLGEKISLKYLAVLICALLALLTLRFYIFYMMIAAVGGAFAIGMRPISATSFVRQFVVITVLGLAMGYMGVSRVASVQFETFGNLESIQRGREDQARTGTSGFAKDADVSNTSGVLSAIPVGLLYLLLAPFPWQVANLRQSITIPEMIIWWASVPFLILGLWFTIKYRLRQVSPILIFTSMLTVVYSLFQGNVGTAYRQRSQLLIFYFIFTAVGFVLYKEKREEDARRDRAQREELAAQQQGVRQQARAASAARWKEAQGGGGSTPPDAEPAAKTEGQSWQDWR
jgi:hypothetical protein